MNSKAIISLGDLVRALDKLQPKTGDSRRRIAEALGLCLPEPMAVLPAPELKVSVRVQSAQKPKPVVKAKPKASKPVDKPKPATQPIPMDLVLTRNQDAFVPRWFEEAECLERDTPLTTQKFPLQPLFEASWIRSRLATAFSVPSPEGDIDIEAAVNCLANLQPIDTIHRRCIRTLRHRVQILFDTSEVMTLLDVDRVQLAIELRNILGDDRIEVFGFDGVPWQVFREESFDEEAYVPPEPGTQVAVVTNLGLTPRLSSANVASTSDWVEFAEAVRGVGCSLIAVCPYAPDRVPPRLSELLKLIEWDRDRSMAWRIASSQRQFGSGLSAASVPIRLLGRRNPLALELAELLSLSSRIERELLRAARLELVPEADAGTELDLWFSLLPSARSARAVVLEPSLARELQVRLRASPERFERAWRFLTNFREKAAASNILRLEEEITKLVLDSPPDLQDRVQRLLERVLKALVTPNWLPPQERHGLALWVDGTMSEMDQRVHSTRRARQLLWAARCHLSHRRIVKQDELPPDWEEFADSGFLIPPNFPRTAVGIRLTNKGIELSEPPVEGSSILSDVPATVPRFLQLQSRGHRPWTISFDPEDRLKVFAGHDWAELTISTLDGRQYELRPQASRTNRAGRPTKRGVPMKQAFVIQHVGSDGSDVRARADLVLERLIQPACERTGYEAVRADRLPAELIVEPIVSALATSPLVIADLGRAPWNDNVLMEVGFRLANGRPIVFLADLKPPVEQLPLHLKNRRLLVFDSAAPTDENIVDLCEYITYQQREMYGWRSHYPILEFTIPLADPGKARFVFANEAAVQMYGLRHLEELMAMSVWEADKTLNGYMPKSHQKAFADDQDRMLSIALAPTNRTPPMAKIPAWFASHPDPEYKDRVFWPLLLQHKFSPHRDNSIVMRVAFVDVSKWDMHGPDTRDASSVVKIPDVFRDRRFKNDVFLLYNSLDHAAVRELAHALTRFGLRVWFDEDNLVGHRGLFPELRRAMCESRIIAMVLGKNGLGPWQDKVELADELLNVVKDGKSFAVLLLNDLAIEGDRWLQYVPVEYKRLLQNRLYVPLPGVEELRELMNTPDRPLKFIERMVQLLARALHPDDSQD